MARLTSLGLTGLDEKVLVAPFKPLAGYGRSLVLHWNPRQMELRGVEMRELEAAAGCWPG